MRTPSLIAVPTALKNRHAPSARSTAIGENPGSICGRSCVSPARVCCGRILIWRYATSSMGGRKRRSCRIRASESERTGGDGRRLRFGEHRPSGPPWAPQRRPSSVVARRKRGGLQLRCSTVGGLPQIWYSFSHRAPRGLLCSAIDEGGAAELDGRSGRIAYPASPKRGDQRILGCRFSHGHGRG